MQENRVDQVFWAEQDKESKEKLNPRTRTFQHSLVIDSGYLESR